jgi:hypothetical protein
MKNFKSILNKGFEMNINGYSISVQYGPGNYVDSDIRYSDENPLNCLVWDSDLAEVMITDLLNRSLFNKGDDYFDDAVLGHCTSETVARIISTLVHAQEGEDVRPSIVQIVEASNSTCY